MRYILPPWIILKTGHQLTCHNGMESRIPWDTIHDNLPCWETEKDPDFNQGQEEYKRLETQLDEGALTQREFDQKLNLMFEIGPDDRR